MKTALRYLGNKYSNPVRQPTEESLRAAVNLGARDQQPAAFVQEPRDEQHRWKSPVLGTIAEKGPSAPAQGIRPSCPGLHKSRQVQVPSASELRKEPSGRPSELQRAIDDHQSAGRMSLARRIAQGHQILPTTTMHQVRCVLRRRPPDRLRKRTEAANWRDQNQAGIGT